MRPADAQAAGLVDEVVATPGEMLDSRPRLDRGQPGSPSSRGTVRATGSPAARRPARSLAAQLPAFPANLRKQLKGARLPAPEAILAAAVEGAQVDLDTALTDRDPVPDRAAHRPGRQEHDRGVLLRHAGGQRRGGPTVRGRTAGAPGRRARRRDDGRRHRATPAPAPAWTSWCKDVSPEAAGRAGSTARGCWPEGPQRRATEARARACSTGSPRPTRWTTWPAATW